MFVIVLSLVGNEKAFWYWEISLANSFDFSIQNNY